MVRGQKNGAASGREDSGHRQFDLILSDISMPNVTRLQLLSLSLRRWAPPLAWMGVIFWFSSDAWSAEATASWTLPLLQALLPWATEEQLQFLHLLQRKLGHVFEYALLALLWRRALVQKSGRARPTTDWGAFGIAVGYAVFDELHQGWTGLRSARSSDVLLDAGGAGAALLLLRWGWRSALTCLTGLLLWVAAVGGTLLLLLNLSVGVSGRWLWVSAPLAWMALWAWRRCRFRPRPFPLDTP